jgi:hypothetical protein
VKLLELRDKLNELLESGESPDIRVATITESSKDHAGNWCGDFRLAGGATVHVTKGGLRSLAIVDCDPMNPPVHDYTEDELKWRKSVGLREIEREPVPSIDDIKDDAFEAGRQAVFRSMLGFITGELHGDERKVAGAIAHLIDVKTALRGLCEEFGCNEWPDDLNLSDVVEKHLGRKIRDMVEG